MDPAALIPRPDSIPVAWGWFEILLLLTFVVHLLFMNAVLGTVLLSAYREFTGRAGPGSGIEEASRKTPTALALTVNLAVPPLLFLQVLYGQFLYTSSVLMAAWWLSIIGLVILAYYGLYLYDFRFERLGARRALVIGCVAALLLAVSFLLVNNMTLMLQPERWTAYMSQRNGTLLNLGDPTLWPRWLHFVTASVAVGGLWLAILGRLAKGRGEANADARIESGMACFFYATLVQLVMGLWFLLALPTDVKLLFFTSAPHVLMLCLGLAGAGVSLWLAHRRKVWPTAGALAVTVALMAVIRDLVRSAYLDRYFKPSDLQVVPQYSSLILFLITLVAGLAALAYMLRLALRAGKEG